MRATDRLLVIDDDPSVVELVAQIFGDHEVATETSAVVALARIAAGERFDAIVCDVTMPAMTGPELHAALCGFSAEQARRIVFMTGGSSETAARYLAGTPNAVLRKPFDVDDLRRVVRRTAGRAPLAC